VLAGTGLVEESAEAGVGGVGRLLGRHVAVGLDAMFEAVELPARRADLCAGLANVDRDALPLPRANKKNIN
jgi:hypothetical protein